ncbi:sterigmatocystin biosynthesis P450 monooxygenase stcL [Aspergillus arachidicola]|uniref:Sterigmatocystin biosynthesis P450 monooxygenase stcL n=1 Tax=Aspergillus arachidicola TaxID=656916 RepID=A0A2G7ELG3_9EURO|nr:sterigmatocystin biosynthesis P450 monooxygenase stcL [Aspergillus arachidicola]
MFRLTYEGTLMVPWINFAVYQIALRWTDDMEALPTYLEGFWLSGGGTMGISILVMLSTFLALGTTIVYRIWLHPLSGFPGPKCCSVSSIPVAWAQLRGRNHEFVSSLHKKYGSVVRISPSELSFISGAAWNDIYSRSKGRPALERDRTFFNDMLVDPETITMANETTHTRIRRSMAPAFSPRALLEQEPIIQANINLLMDKLEARAGSGGAPTDLRAWFNYTTFDLIGDLAFGESFGCLATSTCHEWVQFVLDHFYTSTLLHVVHRFRPFNRVLAALLPKSLIEKRKAHDSMTLAKVHRRLEVQARRNDFTQHLLDAAEVGTLSPREVEKQASVLILAGSETTSVALTFAIYLVLTHKPVLDQLNDELHSTFKEEQAINLLSANHLKYLHAVIQETLRFCPPISNGFPRQTPPQGATVDGMFIPGKTVVNINHWAAYRSPRNFTLPEQFLPERWLGDPRFDEDAKDVFQPFSVGPRNCIGKKFAYDSMKLILAKFLWRFKPTLLDKSRSWLDHQPTFVSFHQPPLLVDLEIQGQ